MQLTTSRLLLRAFQESDLEELYAIQGDADALQFEPWGPYNSIQSQQWLKMELLKPKSLRRYHIDLAIICLEDQALVGTCILRLPLSHKEDWATIGYVIGRRNWGQGFATEAAQALIQYARGLGNIIGIRAISDSQNIASQRVLEKCGMECVGMTAETEPVKGRFRDMLHYELRF